MEDHFDKEIMKVNQSGLLETKDRMNQINNSLESITNKSDCVENRPSGLKDKVHELERSACNKGKEPMIRIYISEKASREQA